MKKLFVLTGPPAQMTSEGTFIVDNEIAAYPKIGSSSTLTVAGFQNSA